MTAHLSTAQILGTLIDPTVDPGRDLLPEAAANTITTAAHIEMIAVEDRVESMAAIVLTRPHREAAPFRLVVAAAEKGLPLEEAMTTPRLSRSNPAWSA